MPISEFPKKGKGENHGRWRAGDCRKCRNKRTKAWREKNPEACHAIQKKWVEKNPEKVILISIKARAKRDGIPFDLTVDDIVIPDVCPVFNVPIARNNKIGPGSFSPSVDRIIPSLGYIKGNIQIISHLANSMKQNATPEQLNQFADWIKNGQKGITCREQFTISH